MFQVRCWEIDQGGNSKPVGEQQSQEPVLSCAWGMVWFLRQLSYLQNGNVFYAGCDNKAYMWNLGNNSVNQIAQVFLFG